MNGTIIWAAYIITWTAMAVYGGSLFVREKRGRAKPEPKP